VNCLTELVNSRENWDIKGEYEKLGQSGIYFYPYGETGYPEKLLTIPDPPAALFVKGKLPEQALPAVAIIGTRKCSGYGSAMAKELGEVMAGRGIQVISGMARGIDGIGQRAVCEAGGDTFAVLGCGVDVIYPPENRKLYEQILIRGGIISEYIPGTTAKSSLFPPRNRIISGLTDAVVVIEAKEKSGTMITVDMALEQGREVYAMPGRLVDGLSAGCNSLLKQGAGLIISIEEFTNEILAETKRRIADEVITLKKAKAPPDGPIRLTAESQFTNEEKQVYSCLDYTPASLDKIREQCPQISYDKLLKILIGFCLKGFAQQMGAGSYCKQA
jgi:DNA processing protein